MAVLGFQLILTIVVLSVLNKLSAKYSFARWLLTKGNLTRYPHPSNDQLKEAIASGSDSTRPPTTRTHTTRASRRRRGHQDEDSKSETFNVPRNLVLALEPEPLSVVHVIQLPYYHELQWLIDFSLYTVLVYFATEAYLTAFPGRVDEEYNVSIVWCLLSLAFTIKVLLSITAMYFRGGAEAMSERSMCIMFGCGYFLVSMVVLLPNEELLEFGLVPAYRAFSDGARRLLEAQAAQESASGPASFLMFRFWLAVWCGLVGMCFTWPGMRVAKMHKDALVYAEGRRILVALYNLSFIAPLFIILLWVKPIAREYLTVREWPNRGVLMSSETFETTRLLIILGVVILRLGLFRQYLQAYLNIAPQKLRYLNKESGKITNVDLQKLIARVSYYLCVAALQYLAPILLCLFLTFLTKSSGDYRWTGDLLSSRNVTTTTSTNFTSTLNASEPLLEPEFLLHEPEDYNDTLLVNGTAPASNETIEATAHQTLILLRDVFNRTVLRGLTGFILWWTVTVWFSSATIGFVYYTYFGEAA